LYRCLLSTSTKMSSFYMSKSITMSMFYFCPFICFVSVVPPFSFQRGHQAQSNFNKGGRLAVSHRLFGSNEGCKIQPGSVRRGELQLSARSTYKVNAPSLHTSRLVDGKDPHRTSGSLFRVRLSTRGTTRRVSRH
jgi:hypothetical protein